MSPFQERRAHGFTFLEFEQVGTWSLSMGVRGALQAGQECLRGASKRSQPGCISAAQRNEQLPKGGRSNSWVVHSCTCACVLHWDRPASASGNATCCISSLLYSSWVHHLAEQGLQLSTEQGLVRWTFFQRESIPLSLGPGQFLQRDDPPFQPAWLCCCPAQLGALRRI